MSYRTRARVGGDHRIRAYDLEGTARVTTLDRDVKNGTPDYSDNNDRLRICLERFH